MKYILALDQGTTSSRAILFDHAGRAVSVAQKEFQQHFPQPGWVEHDPGEIWSTQSAVLAEAMSQIDARSDAVAAIGITNQRETTVLWDRSTGRAIHNAIVWQDRRTAPMCDALREAGHAELFQQKTGLVLDAYFSGTKIKWLLDNVDGARELAEQGRLAFGTIDSWLVWKLTDGREHVTDATNASRTLLYNIHTHEWDDALLELLEIPHSILPTVCSSSETYGHVRKGIFSNPVPIAGIAGDQQAALFGQMCTQPGMAKNTYGTGCFLLLNTGEEAVASENNLLTTIALSRAGRTTYALEGSVFIGGAVVQWLRDGLGVIRRSEDVEGLARSVADNGGVYLVPAFAGLGAPHWDAYARGTIVGLTRGSTAGHIARAALEAIAFQVADVLTAMEADSGIRVHELRVDGGASPNDLLMQFQADVLQTPIVRPAITEVTASGAAYLAGLAVGFWSGTDEIEALWRVNERFDPRMGDEEASALRQRWTRAVERAGGWKLS